MVQHRATFKSVLVHVVCVSKRVHGLEKPVFKDEGDIHNVFHALEIGCRVLDHDQSALFVFQIVRINYLQKLRANSKLLVRRHH